MTVIPETHADILDSLAMWHVATIGPGGEPQTSPVWIGWDGTHLRFRILDTCQKCRNLEARPQIALSATSPDDPYRYLEVRGSVVRTDSDSDLAFINSMAQKYLDEDVYPFHREGDQRVVMVIEPTHATTMGGAPN